MRNKMKPWLILGVSLQLVFLLAACGGEAESSTDVAGSLENSNEQQSDSGDNGEAVETAQTVEGFETYKDDNLAFSIDYPEDWTLKEVSETAFGFVSPAENSEDKFMENVSIQVNSLAGQAVTLEQFAELLVDQAEGEIADFELISSETVAGEGDLVDAHYLQYNGSQGDLQMSYESVLIIDNDRAFILTYTAEVGSFDEYYGVYEHMLESFAF